MKDQYIKQETYDDLNEIQKKTITDKLNNHEYQGKRGLVPYILEDKLDQNILDEILLNHRVVFSAADGFIVIEYVGQNVDDDDSVNINATCHFKPITINSDDVVITEPDRLIFDGVFGDYV